MYVDTDIDATNKIRHNCRCIYIYVYAYNDMLHPPGPELIVHAFASKALGGEYDVFQYDATHRIRCG